MKRFQMLTSTACWLILASTATAQHIDIMIWNASGKLEVGQYDYDNLVASQTRVHIARLDTLYSVNNPGFTAFDGPDALPGNTDLQWDFLPMTVDSGPHAGYASTLLYWDGVGATPSFGPTPTDAYEFSLYGQNGPGTADGSNAIIPGDVIDTTPPNGAIHEHLYYFLDDNGDGLNTTLPSAGIYLVSMRLRMAGLEESKPFFMVWATPELEVIPAIRPAALWVNERIDSLVVEELPGDYNSDGSVDAADYTVWRDAFEQTGDLAADGNADGTVDLLDYNLWQDNYGSANGMASTAVPEPSCLLLLAVSFISAGTLSRRTVLLAH